VVDSNVGGERDTGARSHGDSGGGAGGQTTDVAAEVLGAEVGDGGVVVRVLADVLVGSALDAVGSQALEDVVAADCVAEQHRGDGGDGEGLHGERLDWMIERVVFVC
jgi:hypothetical protein